MYLNKIKIQKKIIFYTTGTNASLIKLNSNFNIISAFILYSVIGTIINQEWFSSSPEGDEEIFLKMKHCLIDLLRSYSETEYNHV